MVKKTQLPACIARVVLVGFMGAGKSSVGELLAQKLGWPFFDADQVLESRQGTTIAEIFARHGEEQFRRLEAGIIDQLIGEERRVLALGGGAMESAATRRLLLQTPETCVIFLQAPLEIMIARCEQQPGAAIRPVLNDRERLRSRFASRLPHYQSAHLAIETASLTVEETARQIFDTIGTLLKETTPA